MSVIIEDDYTIPIDASGIQEKIFQEYRDSSILGVTLNEPHLHQENMAMLEIHSLESERDGLVIDALDHAWFYRNTSEGWKVTCKKILQQAGLGLRFAGNEDGHDLYSVVEENTKNTA